MYCLQNRWKLENNRLRYYGLRNKSVMFKNVVKLTAKQAKIVSSLPRELTDEEYKCVGKLIGAQIVDESAKRVTPHSLDEARFCANCTANDFIIPGLEFDENGLCPMCQTVDETKNLKSVVPIKNVFPKSKKSRFDVAVFYTGGKDSTFVLYYLSKVLNLRVLALTWEIPYISDNAAKSIQNAKRTLPNAEFITRKVCDADLKKIYSHLYKISDNTCLCPTLAYALFYPEIGRAHV